MAGVDTPEKRTRNLQEKALGIDATNWLKKKLEDTIAGCFITEICTEDTRQGIERSMNSLATKAFALYAAEKAGQANERKKTEACPKCGE